MEERIKMASTIFENKETESSPAKKIDELSSPIKP